MTLLQEIEDLKRQLAEKDQLMGVARDVLNNYLTETVKKCKLVVSKDGTNEGRQAMEYIHSALTQPKQSDVIDRLQTVVDYLRSLDDTGAAKALAVFASLGIK